MNFVDYISKVAPEGETCLLVKQKPVGSEQHADGTIKATCCWRNIHRPIGRR